MTNVVRKVRSQAKFDAYYFEILADLYAKMSNEAISKKYGAGLASVDAWKKELKPVIATLTPDFARICFGKRDLSRHHFDVRWRESKKVWEIDQRFEATSFEPDVKSALRYVTQSLKKARAVTFPKSCLPDYLIPIDFQNGVHYVAAMVSEIPTEMVTLDKASSEVSLRLKFEVPLEKADAVEEIRFQLLHRLIASVYETLDSDGSVRVTRVLRQYSRVTMTDRKYKVFRHKGLTAQLDELRKAKSERLQQDAFSWKDADLSEEVVEQLHAYMQDYAVWEAENAALDDAAVPIDVSDALYVVAFTDRETLVDAGYVDKRWKGKAARLKKIFDKSVIRPVIVQTEGFFYVPRGKIKQSWKCREREQLLKGGRNTGKTLSNAYRSHLAACLFPGTRILVFRSVFDRILDSYLPTYETKIAKLDLPKRIDENLMVKREGGANPTGYTYWNGSIIAFAGLADKEGLLSQEWDLAHSVETAQIALSDWIHVATSIGRGVAKNTPYHFILGDCNPPEAGRYHWIFKYQELVTFDTDHFDNPELYDPDTKQETASGKPYLDSLRKLPPEERARFYEGKLYVSDNLVYSDFSHTRHVITRKEFWKRMAEGLRPVRVFMGQDTGYRPSPGVLLLCMLGSDHAFYVIRGTAKLETPYEVWERLALIYARWSQLILGKPIEKLYCEHDTQIQDRFKRWGLPVEPADKKNKLAGIRDVQDMFVQENGIYIVQEHYDYQCPKLAEENVPYTLIEELESYCFSDKYKNTGNPPEPEDKNDHWLDTMLYIVRSARLGRPRYVRAEVVSYTTQQIEAKMIAAQDKRWKQYEREGIL